MGFVTFRGEYRSWNGTQYRIDIYDNDQATEVTPTAIKIGSGGAEISYKGEGSERDQPIVTSECKVPILIEDDTIEALITNAAASMEQRYWVYVYRDVTASDTYSIYWFGRLLEDLVYIEDAAKPYEIMFSATDGISTLNEYYYGDDPNTISVIESPLSTDDPADQIEPMQSLLYLFGRVFRKLFDVANPPVLTEVFRTACIWYNKSQFSSSPVNTLDPFSVTRLDVSAYIEKTDFFEEWRGWTYYEILKDICKAFGCRFMLSDGAYRVMQTDQYYNTTLKETKYDWSQQGNEAGYFINSTRASINPIQRTINQTDIAISSGAMKTYQPPLRQVQVHINMENSANLLVSKHRYDYITPFGTVYVINQTGTKTTLQVSGIIEHHFYNNVGLNAGPKIQSFKLRCEINDGGGNHYRLKGTSGAGELEWISHPDNSTQVPAWDSAWLLMGSEDFCPSSNEPQQVVYSPFSFTSPVLPVTGGAGYTANLFKVMPGWSYYATDSLVLDDAVWDQTLAAGLVFFTNYTDDPDDYSGEDFALNFICRDFAIEQYVDGASSEKDRLFICNSDNGSVGVTTNNSLIYQMPKITAQSTEISAHGFLEVKDTSGDWIRTDKTWVTYATGAPTLEASTGLQITDLMLRRYIKCQILPNDKLSANFIVRDKAYYVELHHKLIYDSSVWICLGAVFQTQTDSWNGEWYKLADTNTGLLEIVSKGGSVVPRDPVITAIQGIINSNTPGITDPTHKSYLATTNNSTKTQAYLSNGKLDTLPENSVVGFVLKAVAIQKSGAAGTPGDSGYVEVRGIIKNIGGTTAIVGTNSTTTIKDAAISVTPTVEADNTNNAMKVSVVGETNKDINWNVKVEKTIFGFFTTPNYIYENGDNIIMENSDQLITESDIF